MTNHVEARVRVRDAENELSMARTLFAGQGWAGAVLHGQLCVEQSAKAVIACFENPEHEHDCSRELFGLLAENVAEMTQRLGEEMMTRLRRLGIETNRIARWHEIATYGDELPDGTRLAAADLISEADAQWALALAERSFATARDFAQAWLGA
jgi:HEPN domain-containing protein